MAKKEFEIPERIVFSGHERATLSDMGLSGGQLTLLKFVRNEKGVLTSRGTCLQGCPPTEWRVGSVTEEQHEFGLAAEPLQPGGLCYDYVFSNGTPSREAALLVRAEEGDILRLNSRVVWSSRFEVLDELLLGSEDHQNFSNVFKDLFYSWRLANGYEVQREIAQARSWKEALDLLQAFV